MFLTINMSLSISLHSEWAGLEIQTKNRRKANKTWSTSKLQTFILLFSDLVFYFFVIIIFCPEREVHGNVRSNFHYLAYNFLILCYYYCYPEREVHGQGMNQFSLWGMQFFKSKHKGLLQRNLTVSKFIFFPLFFFVIIFFAQREKYMGNVQSNFHYLPCKF